MRDLHIRLASSVGLKSRLQINEKGQHLAKRHRSEFLLLSGLKRAAEAHDEDIRELKIKTPTLQAMAGLQVPA